MPTLQEKYNKKHVVNVRKNLQKIRKAYKDVLNEVVKLSYKKPLNINDEFFFREHKVLNKKVNVLMNELYSDVYGTTVSGSTTEWDLAVEKNNVTALAIYGKKLDELPYQYRTKYLSNNAAARRNFIYRKDNGLNLSQKVWKNTRQFKTQLELALEMGIGKGKSAAKLASEITRYLNDPDKLFRRVKDKETGVLRLSKAAKAYSPGQGRSRSSYKNALRLTRNENNFSYEGSNGLKRQQQDFVVGLLIKTSPQHDPADDKGGISCLALQGRYPKDFDWTYKWHVNCICTSFTILKTPEEFDKDLDLILEGKEPTTKSSNQVIAVPKGYTKESKKWLKKSENWKNKPRTFANNKV